MIPKYRNGTVFKVYEDSERMYLIVENTKIEEDLFLLVMPVENIKEIDIELKKLIVFRVTKDEEMSIEKDVEVIEKVLKKVFENADKK